MIRVKLGVSLDGLSSEILYILAHLAEDHEVWITSGTEYASGRVPGSLHSVGRAVDVRWTDDILAEIQHYVREHEAPDWVNCFDIIPYPDSHIHIEWDPR